MRKWTLPRVSPGTVVASIALTVALTGTSVAAVTQLVPRNSVGTAQLKNNAVSTVKLRNQSVTGAKIRSNTVTSSDVRNGSLIRADFAPGQLGEAAPGEPGQPGISGLQRVVGTTAMSSVNSKSVTVSCPSGKRVVGGGARAAGSGSNRISVVESYPDANESKWNARAVEVVTTTAAWELEAYALCAIVVG
jgi:hypothetical protein